MDYQHISGAQKRKERAARKKKVTEKQKTLESLGFSTKVNVTKADISDDVVDYTAPNQIADVETESHICIPVIEHAEAGSIVSVQPEKQKGVAENKLFDFDIGFFQTESPAPAQAEEAVRRGPESYPSQFPDDVVWAFISHSPLSHKLDKRLKCTP